MFNYQLQKFQPENQGEISESISQNWTPQAIECYQNHCDCSKCSINIKEYSFTCQMPKIIKVLQKIAPIGA